MLRLQIQILLQQIRSKNISKTQDKFNRSNNSWALAELINQEEMEEKDTKQLRVLSIILQLKARISTILLCKTCNISLRRQSIIWSKFQWVEIPNCWVRIRCQTLLRMEDSSNIRVISQLILALTTKDPKIQTTTARYSPRIQLTLPLIPGNSFLS